MYKNFNQPLLRRKALFSLFNCRIVPHQQPVQFNCLSGFILIRKSNI